MFKMSHIHSYIVWRLSTSLYASTKHVEDRSLDYGRFGGLNWRNFVDV